MPRDGSVTRDKILDKAQGLILERGYAGMSVDSLIETAGITKGAFFYHFKSKNDLAMALLKRFDEADMATFKKSQLRAEKLSRDPLQQLLIFIGLFEEFFEDLTEPYPGCLFAAYIYELGLFDETAGEVIANSFTRWRKLLQQKLDAIVVKYPPKIKIDTASLADTFLVVLEGAFITSKAVNDPKVIAQQLRHFKNYIELLFH